MDWERIADEWRAFGSAEWSIVHRYGDSVHAFSLFRHGVYIARGNDVHELKKLAERCEQ